MTTTIHNPNKACCTIAPVLDEDYTPKGIFKPYGGCDKAYFTGNSESKKALQGADLLAQATNALVIEPNYFPTGALDYDLYVERTEKNQAAIQAWWGKYAVDFTAHIPITDGVLQAARDDGAQKLGIVGFCFGESIQFIRAAISNLNQVGGKVATITATDASKVDAIAVVHPTAVAIEDALNLAVPIAFFPSNGEPEDQCAEFLKALENKPFASKVVTKRYPNRSHGWAGARADLKNPDVLKDYKDVFERLSRFFNDNLAV